jgi:hypothetical protein
VAIVTVPNFHALRGGRLEATCGSCLGHSLSVAGPDAEAAWAELQRAGWTLYTPKTGTRSYALCQACTADPPDVDRDAAAARKSRKRK